MGQPMTSPPRLVSPAEWLLLLLGVVVVLVGCLVTVVVLCPVVAVATLVAVGAGVAVVVVAVGVLAGFGCLTRMPGSRAAAVRNGTAGAPAGAAAAAQVAV